MQKNESSRGKIFLFSILQVFFLLLEFEVMINYSKEYLYLIVLAFLNLICLYFLVSAIIKSNNEYQMDRDLKYDEILKSEKANYLLLRKNFQEIENRFDYLDQRMIPLSKIMEKNELKIGQLLVSALEDQKKVAKITISRNKENGDALAEKMSKLQDSFNNVETMLSVNKSDDFTEYINTVEMKNQEILSSIKSLSSIEQEMKILESKHQEVAGSIRELELSLKNEILQALNGKIKVRANTSIGNADEIENLEFNGQDEENIISSMDNNTEAESIPDLNNLVMEEESDSDSLIEEESNLGSLMGEDNSNLNSIVEEESIPDLSSLVEDESESNLNNLVEDESESNLNNLVEDEQMPDLNSLVDEEPLAEQNDFIAAEPELDNLVDIEPLPELDSLVEESIISEVESPQPEEEMQVKAQVEPPQLDLSNPNKVMTPEDIAALLAQNNETQPEKPPMPDLSDPNRVMTPEDIQALLNNI
jgi:hypothetical protein